MPTLIGGTATHETGNARFSWSNHDWLWSYSAKSGSRCQGHPRGLYASAEVTNGRGPYRTYLDSGYYYEQIQRYKQFFPDNQIKIVFFSDLKKDTYSFIKSIEQFIGFDYYTDDNFPTFHRSKALESEKKQPPMDPEVRQWLVDHYRDHNAKLSQIIDRDLSDWDRVSD